MQYSESFKKEKSYQIEKLKKQNALIQKMEKEGVHVGLLTGNQSQVLQQIHEKNLNYLKKLEQDEFEIAIVGLEKAGKSTFANALIENTVLPAAPERCTFTSTCLLYGTDKAHVTFYTEAEFNKIFISLLEEIEYPDAQNMHFKTLNEQTFVDYFESLKQSNKHIFNSHSGKTDEEIREILRFRDRLILTGETREFSGDVLTKEEFQSYIKGQNLGGNQVDTSRPRSVKNIRIESSKLSHLKSAVIYDVPGFDSPTRLHERQTIERLKMADAIILVTNVGDRPNITAPQLDTIRRESDTDGILLKDKLFTFGNKLDMAGSPEIAKNNEAVLRKEIVERYKIGEDKRIFVGSAKKYLIDHHLVKEEEVRLVTSGVDEIRSELIRYYQNERFEILKRKIEKNVQDLKQLFNEILNSIDDDIFDEDYAERQKFKIMTQAADAIKSKLSHSLQDLKAKLKTEMEDEQHFSKKFAEYISYQEHLKEINAADIEYTKIHENESITKEIPIERINIMIRRKLHQDFLKEFSDLIEKMTDEKAQDIQARILHALTQSIVGHEGSALFDEVLRESEKLVHSLTHQVAHNAGRFSYLIERFSRNLFDILISTPRGSHDREQKYCAARKEFDYLDTYYSNNQGKLIPILAGDPKAANSPQQIPSYLDLHDIGRELLKYAINNQLQAKVNEIKKFAKDLQNIQNSGQTMSPLQEVWENVSRSTNEDTLLEEINMDIRHLKSVLEKAVIPSANLELAFLNSVDKQIKRLIHISASDQEATDHFNDFLSKVIYKIKANTLQNINQEIERNKLKQVFIAEMKTELQ